MRRLSHVFLPLAMLAWLAPTANAQVAKPPLDAGAHDEQMPVAQPPAQPATQDASELPEPAPEPATEPSIEPATEPASEPLPEPAPDPAVDEIIEEPLANEDESPTPKDSPLEKPSPHQGHFIALGLHGVMGTANDRDRGRRGPAFGEGYSLRVGERIFDRLDLGLALAFASVGGDDPWSFGRLTVHAQGYATEKAFVHAGFGFGAAGGGDPEDPDFSRGRFGDVYTIGAGYNFFLSDTSKSGGWLLTPVFTAEYGRDDQFPNAGIWLGVEISRWWGLPRNQLDLDFDEAYKRR